VWRYTRPMSRDAKTKYIAPAAFGIGLLLAGCGDRQTPASAQSTPVQQRGSRIAEYRAALDAYVAGRQLEALPHFRAAAEQGHVNAQYYTGLMYANGEGTKQDYREAAKWYQMAAEHNQPDALVQLARLYATGTGVDMDVKKSIELFGRAAKAYPPGDKRDQAIEQKNALAAVLSSTNKPAEGTSH
jgi:TPR repeat protein